MMDESENSKNTSTEALLGDDENAYKTCHNMITTTLLLIAVISVVILMIIILL